jgi:Holliday junction resolvasome RuvABC endonuclease subunit
MKILGIDLSYHCGYAVLDGDTNRLLDKGIIQLDDLNVISIGDLPIDFQYLENAKAMATALSNLIATTNPDIIVIEETNQGKNRWSQKGLEFAHAILLERILLAGLASKVRYLDSSKWR